MLLELSLENIAIIESLRLQFAPGFGVLTGETGAGKSIIIDAMTLLLGGRASAEIIRTGCERASVEGVFGLSPETSAVLRPVLEERGLSEDGDQLILRREIGRSRRNVCRINGRAVPLGILEEVGRHLVDIHGQGEHLSLLQVRHHIDSLDQFGGLMVQRQTLAQIVRELRRVRGELEALRRDERELARRMDLLSYQLDEIGAAELQAGEEAKLKRERALLANSERRMQLAAELYALLYEGDEDQDAAVDFLGAVVERIRDLAELDESISSHQGTAESVLYQLEDLARSIREYRDEVEVDPAALDASEDRLETIRGLKRKYGDSIEEVLAFAQRAEAELETISHSEERIEELAAQETALLAQVAERGVALSEARREAAERLCEAVEAELADLSMEQAQFLVDIRWTEASDGVEIQSTRYGFGLTGLDRVEFFIAPNPGEEPKPLARTASGGETSRLMLALKGALSAIDPLPTLIFDEIDSGIGGRTGTVVGHKLWSLAAEHQVFCVTHLPQIASYGSQHYRVAKEVADGRTASSARQLIPEERVEEIAVMLGGEATEATRRSAEELLKRSGEDE